MDTPIWVQVLTIKLTQRREIAMLTLSSSLLDCFLFDIMDSIIFIFWAL